MQTVKIHTTQNISIEYEVAGLGERIFGRLIDLAIFLTLFLAYFFTTKVTSGIGSSFMDNVMGYTFLLIFGFYDLACEIAFNGQSIGKRLMKIRVISLDGSRPSFGQYLMRWIFRLVDFMVSGQLAALVSVAVSEKKQRIGDIVAGTTLIRTSSRTDLEQIAFSPVKTEYVVKYPDAIKLTEPEISLIHEVLLNYSNTGNQLLLRSMADKIREHLSISVYSESNDWKFLKTIVKDFNHLAAQGGE